MLKHSVSKDPTSQQNNKSEFLSQMISFLDIEYEYIGIINKKGRLEEVIGKQNDVNMSEEKKELFFMTLQLNFSMQSDFDEEFGKLNYMTIERQHSRFILISITNGIILIKLNKSINPFFIMDKITEIFNSYERFPEIRKGVVNIEYL